MPVTTPQIKIAAVKARAGEVVLHGDSYDEAYSHARALARRRGLAFVHPYDDPDVIAGQGTIAMEILRQHPGAIHAVFVPIGGGGLISGIAACVKRLRPEIKVIGVEPEDADAMYRSLKAGRRVGLSQVGLFADGVAVKEVGRETFRLCRELVDDVVRVDTDAICAAIKDVFEDTRSILEPAGALAIAGAKSYVAARGLRSQTLVAVACGANMNFDRLRFIAERAELGEAREAILAVTIPERPGSFRHFCSLLGPRNVTEFNYRYADPDKAQVFVGVQVRNRGETQALAAATLGTKSDEQKIEALEGEFYRHFMLHYNFPSFSVGEVRRFGSPSRRDIGHGALAERAVEAVLPPKEDFPYTIRIVSDILESNGSTSMATVCGASLALMDAGVPIRAHVAGIAMGLVKEGDRVGILTDISGTEDHFGDMDFKVAGTEKGVTALQMDIKITGVSVDIMRAALADARQARLFVLDRMREAIEKPRAELSPFAPRFVTIRIRQEKIREIIGPGGKVIRGIQEQTGTKIDVEDDGRVTVFSPDNTSVQKALSIIQDICREVELDRIYLGKVKKIVEFGAFVEVIPNTEGLLHISQIAETRIRSVQDVLTEGDEVLVKVIEIDGSGKMRLSRKIALRDQPALADKERLKNPQAANPPRA